MIINWPLMKIFFNDRLTWRFAFGALLGLSFALAAILSTLGLMSGFNRTLLQSLQHSSGDLALFSQQGFFIFSLQATHLQSQGVEVLTPVLQTEGFVIAENYSKGVMIKGIERDSFAQVTSNSFPQLPHNTPSVVLGSILLEQLGLKIGSEITLAFAAGNKQFTGLPFIGRFKIAGIIEHGIYQKDLRTVYLPLSLLQEILGLPGKVNSIYFNLPLSERSKGSDWQKSIIAYVSKIQTKLDFAYYVRPFWAEFRSLMEVVDIEKRSIVVVLYVVVIVSIFNLLAFLVFINEKKYREIFLLKALGMGPKRLGGIFFPMLLLFFLSSCVLAIIMVQLFQWCLLSMDFFKMPGEIYFMNRFLLYLDWQDYLLVFGGSGVLIWLLAWPNLRKLNQKSPLQGLRKEYT